MVAPDPAIPTAAWQIISPQVRCSWTVNSDRTGNYTLSLNYGRTPNQ
jgi:hypothetical protein